jgi:RimJ/RimL family protein N-acetyltransferase
MAFMGALGFTQNLCFFLGPGFGFEMLKGALDEPFDRQKLRRITLRILPNNEPSIQLAKKLGFTREGTLHSEYMSASGDCVDIILFSKVRNHQNKITRNDSPVV